MIKLITHNDLDGIGCEVVFKLLYGDKVDVFSVGNNEVNNIVEQSLEELRFGIYEQLFITDLSINEELAEIINKEGLKVQLLDHHPSATHLNKYSFANVTTHMLDGLKDSGTHLSFIYLLDKLLNKGLYNESLEDFVELVRQYDTWEWKEIFRNEEAKQLSDLLYILGREKFVNDMVHRIKNNEELFSRTDKAILKIKQKEIDNYINIKEKELIIKDFKLYKIGIVMADSYTSELGNILCERHEELDFVAIIKKETVSLRTVKDDVNLTDIAKQFGGGGHPKASGFPLSNVKLNNFINDIFDIKEGE
jgi:oligoribonuclease NrnB/cAMP/cGMP phosphodiesterase (DHH superfamily)